LRRILKVYTRRLAHCLYHLAPSVALGWVVPALAGQAITPAASPVYDPPHGFWLIPSDYSKRLYGPSADTANWAVAQWDIPRDLPPFHDGVAENEFAQVTINPDGSYTLAQNGSALPCEKDFRSGHRLVDEFDLLVQPVNRNFPGYPQASKNVSSSLSLLRHIYYHITATLLGTHVLDTACRVTQVGYSAGVVLTNPRSRQTLFYNLRLAVMQSRGNQQFWRLPPPMWPFAGENPQSGGQGQFGYGDNITSYGGQPLEPGVQTSYSLDLLPRLTNVLRTGAERGIDQDLSHWILSGTHHGGAIWGHVRSATQWTNYSMTLE
jgi:hypothetical protein